MSNYLQDRLEEFTCVPFFRWSRIVDDLFQLLGSDEVEKNFVVVRLCQKYVKCHLLLSCKDSLIKNYIMIFVFDFICSVNANNLKLA